jgi:hypothetical protein
MELVRTAMGSGEFRILDARLTPGVADPASYAEAWAIQSARTPHSLDAAAKGSTKMGSLNEIRFSITLWVPGSWRSTAGIHATATSCPAQ